MAEFKCDGKIISVNVVSTGEYELYCETASEQLIANGKRYSFFHKRQYLGIYSLKEEGKYIPQGGFIAIHGFFLAGYCACAPFLWS